MLLYNCIFNSKKTVCIKFGNEVIRNEAAFLNNEPLKGTDQTGTFMSLKCVVYYANYRSGHQSSKI